MIPLATTSGSGGCRILRCLRSERKDIEAGLVVVDKLFVESNVPPRHREPPHNLLAAAPINYA